MAPRPRPLARPLVLLAVLLVAGLIVAGTRTIVGASPEDGPAPELAHCVGADENEHRDRCYERAMGALLAKDTRAGIEQVRRHARTTPAFARRCHMLMHPFGREYAERVDIAQVPHDGKDCAAGFIHGALEQQLGGEGALDRRLAATWCTYAHTPSQTADCEHGLGHVLMRNLRNELPSVLRRCTAIGDAGFARHCASGAFMENRFAAEGRDDAEATRYEPDAEGMCNAVPAAVLDTCHAWAVREVSASRRLEHCTTSPRARSCRVGAGATSRSARPCAQDADCWYGRGYQVAVPPLDPRAECREAAARAALLACAEGVGLRRGALSRTGTAGDATMHCAVVFEAPRMQAACARGFARRLEPIDFV
jgi:hypothetical protein